MSNVNKLPYQSLGDQLRSLREQSSESMAEAAGAVEIEEKALQQIESGRERPSEDILMLLISHFAVDEDKAAELWDLAGYEPDAVDDDQSTPGHDHDAAQVRQQTLMVMIDPRVMYSDGVEVVTNNQGVVLNFSQNAGQNGQPLTVSRVGMSREQAKLVMGVLHQALYNLENPNRKKLNDGNT